VAWLYVALACLGASFGIYMTMLKHAPIGPVFAASHLDIVSVTLFSIAYLGDRLTLLQAAGCCAIVAGVLILAVTEGKG
jgi:drug/metabolite transporter (DMT)-like permease